MNGASPKVSVVNKQGWDKFHHFEQLCEETVQQYKRKQFRLFIIWGPPYHQNIQRIWKISALQRLGRNPSLNARDLWSLKRHCIKNRHHCVMDIATWDQEHFRQPLSVSTVGRYIYKCKLKLYHANHIPPGNTTASLGPNSFEMHWCVKEKETGTVVWWVRVSNCFFFKSWASCPPCQRWNGPFRLLLAKS